MTWEQVSGEHTSTPFLTALFEVYGHNSTERILRPILQSEVALDMVQIVKWEIYTGLLAAA